MKRDTYPEIRAISLEGTLPRVFLDEQIPESEIWKRDVRFERGGRYLIEAASGTGKSSLCAYIFGSRQDYEGVMRFDGVDIRSLSIAQWQEIRRRHLAYLPQELALFPELTALQNVKLKNDLTGYATDEQIRGWLDRMGIGARTDFPVGQMSIGQQQRVAVIRAICQPFDFIFLDEPVSHLDSENNRIAAAIIAEEAQRQGAAVIATSVGNQLALDGCKLLRL
ncbi:MAG TPA: ABC transporter ATP-binding protein [Porphyromonadaceae bacterium]|nr:ABC transporter ATP-binding protein [Porphyromonadaceae bacterium]